MPVRWEKRVLATALARAGIARAAEGVDNAAHGRNYIRAVNYHGTPARLAGQFRRQLAYFRERYAPVTARDLESFLSTGQWTKSRPGLIVSFDDALRSNIDTALPLVEESGFVAWLFAPVDFVNAPLAEQKKFAAEHRIHIDEDYADGRAAASWSELRALDQRHVVGCHTKTHRRLGAGVSPGDVEQEVTAAKQAMETHLARPVESFCWVGGEESSYSREAAQAVARAGYRFGFMTNNERITAATHPLQLQRTNIEADWPVDVVRFQLSGIMDVMYAKKRARVNALTSTPVQRAS